MLVKNSSYCSYRGGMCSIRHLEIAIHSSFHARIRFGENGKEKLTTLGEELQPGRPQRLERPELEQLHSPSTNYWSEQRIRCFEHVSYVKVI